MVCSVLGRALFIPGGVLFIPRGCLIHPHPALIIPRVGLNWSPGMNWSLYLNLHEDTSAHLSGRGELHGAARVMILVTLKSVFKVSKG